MRINIVKMLCLFLFFAIEIASAYLRFTSSYRIICESIFESCELSMEKDNNMGCTFHVDSNTLHFSCRLKILYIKDCDIPAIEGYFELNQEAMNMFHCLEALKRTGTKASTGKCEKSEEFYQRQIFQNCTKGDVYKIGVQVFPKQNTKSEYINYLSSNFPNLKHISWCQCDDCLPYNQLTRKFKHINTLELFLCANLTICQDFDSNNQTQIEKLRIELRPLEMNTEKNIVLLNEQLLRGMQNLREFEFVFSNKVTAVRIPQQLFQGSASLTTIRFVNCNITKLSKDNFEDLVNLRTLTFKRGAINDYDWLNSTVIQNKLTILELDSDVVIPKTNMSAFICLDSIICNFNVDINKKPCPDGCRCFLYRSDYTFVIECELHDYKRKIPELPIPITGNASLIFESYLTELPNLTLYGYSNLRELHVANNALSSLTLDQLPPNLTLLDIESNQFEFLDYKVLEYLLRRAGKMRMRLSLNPWTCYCDDFHLLEFINNMSEDIVISDLDDLMCYKDNLALLMPWKLEDACKSYLLYHILGSLLGLAVMIIIFLCAKTSIFMWLYERNLCLKWISRPEPKADTALTIDAFLAFSHVDLGLIKEYLEKLEKGPREYRLCFYQRDWQIGESIPDCILQSIEHSKRVIILMTSSFVNSSWGMFEFRSAIKATSMDKDKRLIVILYPDVDLDRLEPELKRYMKYNTYLRRDDPLFWRKLIFAMPHKQAEPTERAAIEAI